MNEIARFWRTLRHLRPVQIHGRLRFALVRPSPDLSPPPEHRSSTGSWCEPARRQPSLNGEGVFFLLNEHGSLDVHGWDGPSKSKLWRYNQHYFDDLNAQRATERRDWHRSLIARWIADNAPGQGSGWEPYPTSLRIVNWVKLALSNNNLGCDATQSLAIQARWLRKRLEWHLLGNHLFVNSKALMYAGLFFEGAEADEWRRTSTRILSKEILEQILPDGGQFELSPMYHALALEDLLDLINLWNNYRHSLTNEETDLLKICRNLAPKMLRWLDVMSHPDDRISFFNDAAFDIAPETYELRAFADRLGLASVQELSSPSLIQLKDSGYVRLERGPVVLLADLARVGPDYLPGHAHADTLSFELSVHGQRIIVNSGTSEYGVGPERARQRGTAAHSTVEVDGQNSSEVWGGFRVARRAHVADAEIMDGLSGCDVRAGHDGYVRILKNGPLHQRHWHLEDCGLSVSDSLSDYRYPAIARYIFHPDIKLHLDGRKLKMTMASGEFLYAQIAGGDPTLDRARFHPGFGLSLETTCLCIPLERGGSSVHLTWGSRFDGASNTTHENKKMAHRCGY